MTEPEMRIIAALIARALRGRDNAEELSSVRKEVAELCARFPAYPDGDPHIPAPARSLRSA
jgi:glycine/serine hydroxymethyltransferase